MCIQIVCVANVKVKRKNCFLHWATSFLGYRVGHLSEKILYLPDRSFTCLLLVYYASFVHCESTTKSHVISIIFFASEKTLYFCKLKS